MSKKMAALKPAHFLWRMNGAVAVAKQKPVFEGD